MAEEKKQGSLPHSVVLENRKAFTATGVSDVDSFDDQTIVAYTDLGELVVRGHGLHINRLNMETGELTLTGEVDSLTYTEGRRENGFLSRHRHFFDGACCQPRRPALLSFSGGGGRLGGLCVHGGSHHGFSGTRAAAPA